MALKVTPPIYHHGSHNTESRTLSDKFSALKYYFSTVTALALHFEPWWGSVVPSPLAEVTCWFTSAMTALKKLPTQSTIISKNRGKSEGVKSGVGVVAQFRQDWQSAAGSSNCHGPVIVLREKACLPFWSDYGSLSLQLFHSAV